MEASGSESSSVSAYPFASLVGVMIGSSTESASGNLRVKNSCEASLYALEISEDGLLLEEGAGADDDSRWEFDKELSPVMMVTVDDPDELCMINC